MRKGYEMKVRIDRTFEPDHGKIRAIASAAIGDFAIHGIKVLDSRKGLFVQMPQNVYEKDGEKHYSDIFHPITAEAREALNEAVMGAYEEAIAESEDMNEALPFGPGM